MTDTKILVLIPNNHRDPETTNVRLNPHTGDIIFDSLVRITDSIVHPYDKDRMVKDYSYALSPDEFFTLIGPSSSEPEFAFFRGKYYRLDQGGHQHVKPSYEVASSVRPYVSSTAFDVTEIPVVDASEYFVRGREPIEAVHSERRMKVKLDGLTSLWVFCEQHWDETTLMLVPDWVYPGGQHQRTLHARWQNWSGGLCARLPVDDLGTRPPIDSAGYAHIRFSELDIENYRMRIVGVSGERGPSKGC